MKGWQCGHSRWTRPQLEARSGVAFRSMEELFRGAPEWPTYLRGADGNKKPRVWELNIGPWDLLAGITPLMAPSVDSSQN